MLNREKFEQEIRKLNDSSFEEFQGFPESCPLAVTKWAETFYVYAEGILPASNTVILAKSTAQQILLGICSSKTFSQSVTIFTSAVVSFAQQIIPGFISGNIYPNQCNGVMPIYPLNLFPIFLKAMNGGSAYDFAKELSTEIDNWFKTGTAININSGITINWN